MREPSGLGVRVAFPITYAWATVLIDMRKERVVDSPLAIAHMR